MIDDRVPGGMNAEPARSPLPEEQKNSRTVIPLDSISTLPTMPSLHRSDIPAEPL